MASYNIQQMRISKRFAAGEDNPDAKFLSLGKQAIQKLRFQLIRLSYSPAQQPVQRRLQAEVGRPILAGYMNAQLLHQYIASWSTKK